MSNQPNKMWFGLFLKYICVIAILIACGLFGTVARAESRACSQKTMDALETESGSIRDWATMRSFYRRYRICQTDDAEVEQGISGSIVRILIKQWQTLPKAQQLFKNDPAFEAFALAGLNITDSTDDLNNIDKLASGNCPTNLHTLCGKIRKAIRTNK